MDHYERLNIALGFIEKRLKDPFTLEEVSTVAFSSHWHFHRIFRFMTGESLKSYIRKRRLSEAGREVLHGNRKIIDIALDYCFQTPESFSRAFKKHFGHNPLQSRKTRQELPFFEPINIFEERYKSVHPGDYIEQRVLVSKEIHVVGVAGRTGMGAGQNYIDIPRFWHEFENESRAAEIPDRLSPDSLMGVYHDFDVEENFTLLIGAHTAPDASVPAGFRSLLLPPAKYMVFTVHGPMPDKLGEAWSYIYGTWLPNSGLERGSALDFDRKDKFFHDPVDPRFEIYIPIL